MQSWQNWHGTGLVASSRSISGTICAEFTPFSVGDWIRTICTDGLDISEAALAELLTVDTEAWKQQMPQTREHLARFGDKLPDELRRQFEALAERLGC